MKKINFLVLITVFVFGFFVGRGSFFKDYKNNNLEIENNQSKKLISPAVTISPTLTLNLSQDFCPVVKVVDGDTIDVEIDGKVKRVRIIGINTPEVVDPRKKVECFGKEASEKAKSILQGKKVRLEKDLTQGDVDKYGRLLRYVFLEDGTDFGFLMIKEGYAFEYTYNLPYKYQQQYKEAQKQAQESKKGLWADDACSSLK